VSVGKSTIRAELCTLPCSLDVVSAPRNGPWRGRRRGRLGWQADRTACRYPRGPWTVGLRPAFAPRLARATPRSHRILCSRWPPAPASMGGPPLPPTQSNDDRSMHSADAASPSPTPSCTTRSCTTPIGTMRWRRRVPATTALRYMACTASPSSSQDSNRRRQDALAQLARCNPSISQNCEIQ
jgi:hypothetical protein